jgi:hypothetical protein
VDGRRDNEKSFGMDRGFSGCLVVEVVGRVACRKTGEARLVNLHCLPG